MGKNGRILFDRPKPTVGCSVSGRRSVVPKYEKCSALSKEILSVITL
jgi:hypothetical protein